MMDAANSERVYDGFKQFHSFFVPAFGRQKWRERSRNNLQALLVQAGERPPGPLNVIWDNAPAHRGEAVREYLRTSGLGLRLVNLPAYSPDFNPDEASWDWGRKEATGNLCLGTKALVREGGGNFLGRLASRKNEVKWRCRTALQSRGRRASARLSASFPTPSKCTSHLGFGLALQRRIAKYGV